MCCDYVQLCMYLTIEHNNDEYLALLQFCCVRGNDIAECLCACSCCAVLGEEEEITTSSPLCVAGVSEEAFGLETTSTDRESTETKSSGCSVDNIEIHKIDVLSETTRTNIVYDDAS